MRLPLSASLVLVALPLLGGCTSQAEEIRQKCATASDPAACQRAEYQKLRDADAKLFEENSQKSGGGGY